jgi:hypothetical protein
MTATPARARAAVRAWTVLLTVHLCVLLVMQRRQLRRLHELTDGPLVRRMGARVGDGAVGLQRLVVLHLPRILRVEGSWLRDTRDPIWN